MIRLHRFLSPLGGRGFPFAIPALSLGDAGSLTLFFALACLAVLLADTGLLNVDSSWYLVATRRWMDGAVLYDGVIEPNPPLMFYLTRLSYGIAAPLGLADKPALLLFLCISAVLSFVFAVALLRKSALSPNQRGVFMCFVVLAFFFVPLRVLGQRENLLIIFLLPLAVWMAFGLTSRSPINRSESRDMVRRGASREVGSGWWSWLPHAHSEMVGIFCALFALPGLLLKPYFFLLPAAAIALRLVQCRVADLALLPRLFSPANIVLAMGAFGYLTFIYLVHPLYMERIVPFALLVYDDFGSADAAIITHPLALFLLVIMAAVGLALYDREQRWGQGRREKYGWAWLESSSLIFCAYAAGAFLSYVVQDKGFSYHLIPVLAFALLSMIAFLITNTAADRRKLSSYALTMIVLCYLYILYRPAARHELLPEQMDMTLAVLAEKPQSILVLSPFVAGFPMVNELGWRWTSRYPVHWLIPGAWNQLYGSERDRLSKERLAKLELVFNFTRRTTVDDFITERPDIVLINERRKKFLFRVPGFDFITFLSIDPRFVAAWREYHMIGEINPHWPIYVRKDLLDDTTL